MFALSLLASLALAADPAPGMTLEVPALGVTMVVQDGCNITVVGTVPARKAGELAKATASAKSECLTAQARIDAEKRRQEAATARAPSEHKLIEDAGMALVLNRNVRVVTPEGLTVEGGSHMDWQAYGEAVGSGNTGLYAPGMMPAGGDPNLYRLSGGNVGNLYLATPAVPGQVAPAAATAPCGTAAECQATIDAQAAAMASADK